VEPLSIIEGIAMGAGVMFGLLLIYGTVVDWRNRRRQRARMDVAERQERRAYTNLTSPAKTRSVFTPAERRAVRRWYRSR
jgi:hypothetical protein